MIRSFLLLAAGMLIAWAVRELAPRQCSLKRLWLVQTALIVGIGLLTATIGKL